MELKDLKREFLRNQIRVLGMTPEWEGDIIYYQCEYFRLDTGEPDFVDREIQKFWPTDGQCPRWKELVPGRDYLIEKDADGRWMTIEPINPNYEELEHQFQLYHDFVSCMFNWEMLKLGLIGSNLPEEFYGSLEAGYKADIQFAEEFIESVLTEDLRSKWMCQKMGEYRAWLLEKFGSPRSSVQLDQHTMMVKEQIIS